MPLKRILLIVAVVVSAQAWASESPSSIAEYVRPYLFVHVKISPDAKKLAVVADKGSTDVLVVLKVDDLSVVSTQMLATRLGDSGIESVFWVSDERLVVKTGYKLGSKLKYVPDALLDAYSGQWLAVNADGSEALPIFVNNLIGGALVDPKKVQKGVINIFSVTEATVIDPLVDEGSNVLLQVDDYLEGGYDSQVLKYDTKTGFASEVLASGPDQFCRYVISREKVVNYATCFDDRKKDANGYFEQRVSVRKSNGSWDTLRNSDDDGIRYFVFDQAPDGSHYALQYDGSTPLDFGVLNLETLEYRALFKHDVVEYSDFLVSPSTGEIIGVYTEDGLPEVTLTNKDHPDALLYKRLARSFEGQVVYFLSASRDGDSIVFMVRSDRNPGDLYLFDRKTNQARYLLSRTSLDPSGMARVMPFKFDSKDGLRIQAYLTLPAGREEKNLPLIVNPHGGPIGERDGWFFNGEAQLLASRGYAVLNVNFRGSDGYGDAFEEMSHGQWAGGIMADIIGATDWTVEEGYVDGDRICIYGASFGGYAAMMAPIQAPGMFKCAFGYVGAYSAKVQMKESDTRGTSEGRKYLKKALGKRSKTRESAMPVGQADKIGIPVFLVAGKEDKRTPPKNTELMAKALEKAGNKPEGVIIQEGEGHGFYDEQNKIRLYSEMLAFFERHIPANEKNGSVPFPE